MTEGGQAKTERDRAAQSRMRRNPNESVESNRGEGVWSEEGWSGALEWMSRTNVRMRKVTLALRV